MSEKPVHSRRRRLVGWIKLTGAKKVHSLMDKVYQRKNLEMAWADAGPDASERGTMYSTECPPRHDAGKREKGVGSAGSVAQESCVVASL